MNNKYIIYARKSTESDDKQILSIDSQIRELKELAARENLKIIKILQESKSAKTPETRPVFGELLEQINSGGINGILCWKIDRLSRNPVDGAKINWLLQQGIIQHIRTFDRHYYPTDNVLMMNVELGMANQYIRDLSANVKRGNRARYEKGWWCGVAPFGYLNDRINKTIIKDPERFDLIRKIWDLALTNVYSLKQLREKAIEIGLRSRPSKKQISGYISISSIHKMLTNPFYYGEMNTAQGVFKGSHDPMITEEEFDRIQIILGYKGKPRPKNKRFAYTGLIKCGECGCSITAEDKINRFGQKYRYYHCTKKKGPCSQKYIEIKELEPQIVEIIDSITLEKEFVDWAINYLKVTHQQEIKNRDLTTRSHQNEYNRLSKLLNELMVMRLNKLIDDKEFIEGKSRLLKEREKAKELFEDTDHRSKDWLEKAEGIFKFAMEATSAFNNGSIETKKNIIQSIGSNLVLKDKKLTMDLKKPYSGFYKIADRSSWFPD